MNKSERLKRFLAVATLCANHIESYTVPQYGDYPNDQLTDMTQAEIKHDMQRYLNRMGRSSRGKEDAKRDMLKLMHYASEMYLQISGEVPNED
jgi:isochorismate hydrolase